MWFVRPHGTPSFNIKIRTIPMLNLSKITLLLLASIGLTACGALNTLLNEIENAGDECPLEERFCELDEDELLILLPDDVNVDAATTLQISDSIRGVVDQKSGILENISEPTDSPSYDVLYGVVNRSLSGNGTDDGFAYFSIATDSEPRQFVGILEDTDLGNAFNYRLSGASQAKATWRGRLTLIEAGQVSTSEEFDMEVNFTSLQISTPDNITIPTGSDNSNPRRGRLNGDFGVAGHAERTPGELNGMFDIIDDRIAPTPMIGLIGEQGVVGVFSGTYFGGFVASPR